MLGSVLNIADSCVEKFSMSESTKQPETTSKSAIPRPKNWTSKKIGNKSHGTGENEGVDNKTVKSDRQVRSARRSIGKDQHGKLLNELINR